MDHPESITLQHIPTLRQPLLIAAFTGWPDAGEVASATVRYLVRKARARRFATIEGEGFHDFTQQRPQATIGAGDRRSIQWPTGEFWATRDDRGRDLVLFVGPEPQLRWRAYTEAFLYVAQSVGVTEIVTLGGAYDAVPHTGDPKLSVTSSDVATVRSLQDMAVEASNYEGPTSIHSAVQEAAPPRSIAVTGLWGIAPDYVQAIPNWKVCYAILTKLQRFYGLRVDLDELQAAGRALERRVERLLQRDPDLRAYVQQIQELEGPASASAVAPDLDADSVLEEVEALLRRGDYDDGDDDDYREE